MSKLRDLAALERECPGAVGCPPPATDDERWISCAERTQNGQICLVCSGSGKVPLIPGLTRQCAGESGEMRTLLVSEPEVILALVKHPKFVSLDRGRKLRGHSEMEYRAVFLTGEVRDGYHLSREAWDGNASEALAAAAHAALVPAERSE